MEFENELSGKMGCESEGKVHTLENLIMKCKITIIMKSRQC